jgi:polar amino acid transport system substrate-binding protein
MLTPTPPDRVKPLTQGATAQVDISLRWLVGIFLICVLLVFGLRGFFTDLEDELRARGANERARLFVGEEIVRGIQGIEKDIYRMASIQNAAGFDRINKAFLLQQDKLTHDLEVLATGGTARRQLRLNLGGQDELVREATYQPGDNSARHVMEVIEIGPQLGQIRDLVSTLAQLLARRWQTLELEDKKNFFLVEDEIAVLLKQVPPSFERLDENANRLFIEGDQRLRALEAELQIRRDRLKQIETGLIALVVVLGGIAGTLFMRRLTTALGEARIARDETEGQREQSATMLDTLSDGVYATDMAGNITFINAASERILGWSASELVGQQAHQAIHHSRPGGQHFPRAQCPLIAVLEEGASLDGEEHFIDREGHFIPVSFRSKPLMRHGKMVGSLVSFQDMSEKVESEARIRLQQAALDAAANMIVITDRNGVIEYVNPAFCASTGYTADEVAGQQTSLLNSGLHDAAFYRAIWETVLEGKPWEGELNNRRKDGSIYPEQMTITPIVEAGEISHFIAIKRDISEAVRTRTRLKLVETAIQETEQGILITDADPHGLGPTIQYVNAGFSRITGFSRDDAVGQRTGILRGPETDPEQIAQFTQALAAGTGFSMEINYRRKDGSPYLAELHYSPVHDDQGKQNHFIGLLSDIGPRKEAEEALRHARDQALENSRLKSEFLSTMSHEIRTPMNGIIGMTDLLLDTQQDDEQREFTGIVRDSANALLTIINDILDFSKIEAGKLDIDITDFSPTHVVEGTVDLLLSRARDKKLSLMSFVDPALPTCLRGDPTRLRQVLLNLIGNAVKFTSNGTVELSVQQERDGTRPLVRFEIRDTGIGIPPAVQARLFQSFTQADSSTTRKYGGTGLGLAISKRLVELMGGEIGVISEEGKGSTFWFTLPLVACAESSQPQMALPVRSARQLRVLVVDDHSNDRKIIHRYLASWGMANDGASNAEEALKLIRDAAEIGQPYDVALIDFVMPGMDGIGLAQALRDEPLFDQTRLVLLTAYRERDLFERALQAGFASCLVKPVRQSQLFDNLVNHPVDDRLSFRAEAVQPMPTPRLDLHESADNKPLILLAEDNLVNQKVAQVQIQKLGYTLHIVNNGQQAVDAAQAERYAVILMDCQMPVMDGFEATAAIRKAEQSGANRIPIIAMTANAMQGDRERCLAAGMDDYISKPISAELLAAALSRWVAGPPADTVALVLTPFAEPPEPPPQLIDFALLEDYFGDDPQVLAQLLELFQTSTLSLLEKLHAAVAVRDESSVMALSHEAKGSCGNLGIERMAHIATQLETAVEEADWPRILTLSDDLDRAFKQVLGAIAQQSENLPS